MFSSSQAQRDDAPFLASTSPNVTMESMETVVAVAIGILAAVFVGALVVLVVICRRQKSGRNFMGKHCGGMSTITYALLFPHWPFDSYDLLLKGGN
ncbi:hypothetical protein C0J52_10069 [Blattella germanica]|nr:hypothetical protein C0J52_10069 [Blattella germanica]